METACCFEWATLALAPVVASLRGAAWLASGKASTAASKSLGLPPLPVGRLGKIGGDYDFDGKMGAGAFGVVSRAVGRETGEVAAVKTLRIADFARKPWLLASELSVARSVRHPHVARLFEVYSDDSAVYMVMQLCSGGEFFDLVKDGRMSEGQMRTYAWQMLSAVCYLHACRIVHRDVKADNFMLESVEPGALLKLIDFGMSKRYTPGVAMSSLVGALCNFAPEILERSYDELVDVWAVGVVIYASLSGRHPFMDDNDKATSRRIRRGRAAFPSKVWCHISPQAADFVRELLTYDARDRPAAREALCNPWLQAPAGDEADIEARHRAFAAAPWHLQVAMAVAAWHLPEAETRPLANIFARRCAVASSCGPCSDDRPGSRLEVPARVGASRSRVDRAYDIGLALAAGDVDYTTWLAASVDPSLFSLPVVVRATLRALCPHQKGRVSRAAFARAASAFAPSLATAAGAEAAGPSVEVEALATTLAALGAGGVHDAAGVKASAAGGSNVRAQAPPPSRSAPAAHAAETAHGPGVDASRCAVGDGVGRCDGGRSLPPLDASCWARSISSRSTATTGGGDGSHTPDLHVEDEFEP